MATNPVVDRAEPAALPGTAYERFAGVCAIVAGVAGFLYAVAFILLRSDLLSGFLTDVLDTKDLDQLLLRLALDRGDYFHMWF